MIWTLITAIILSILGFAVILTCLILFPSVYIGSVFSYTSRCKKIIVKGWWFHPWIANVDIDIFGKQMLVRVFGRKLFQRSFDDNTDSFSSDKLTEKESEKNTIKQSHEKDTVKEIESVKSVKVDVQTEEYNRHQPAAPIPSDEPVDFPEKENIEVHDDTSFRAEKEISEKNAEATNREQSGVKEEKQGKNRKEPFWHKLQRNRYFFILKNKRWRTKIFKWVITFIKRLFRIISFDRLRISIKAGIEEPALMGKICGVYEMVRYGINVGRGYHTFEFIPVFMRYHFEGRGSFGIKTSVFQVTKPVLVALFTFPYFSTLYLYWKSRKLKA